MQMVLTQTINIVKRENIYALIILHNIISIVCEYVNTYKYFENYIEYLNIYSIFIVFIMKK